MRFVEINEFFQDVLPEIRGCSNFVLRDKIRLAAIEFCRRTLVSQETVEDIDIEAGEALVPIPAPSRHVINHRAVWVKTSKDFLTEYNRKHLAAKGQSWAGDPWNTPKEWPSGFFMRDGDIQLIPAPTVNKPGELIVHMAYLPSRDATSLDELLINDYREAIKYGALARLKMMQGEPWYDPESAGINDREFQVVISQARVDEEKGRGQAETFVQMHPLA